MLAFRSKSHYSPALGSCSPSALVDAAAREESVVLLADRETLAGQPMAHARAAELGLRAVAGVELAGPGGASLVLVARGDEGYRTLCGLVSRRRGGGSCRGGAAPAAVDRARARRSGRGRMPAAASVGDAPRRDLLDALAGGAEGVLVLTGDRVLARRYLQREALDPSALRLLVPPPARCPERAAALAALAREREVPLVADLEVNVASPARARLLRLLAAALGGSSAARPTSFAPASRSDAGRLFREIPRALDGLAELVDDAGPGLRPGRPVLPAPALPTGVSAEVWLGSLASRALERARESRRLRGSAYDRRLEHELEAVRRAWLAPYFLLVADLAALARELDVPMAARGSAAASLLLHLLGASAVDPVAADLLFERFLNERREDRPDVDLDVCSARRDAFIERIVARYGRDRVAHVGAHTTLGRRSVLDACLPALGLTADEVRTVCGRLPPADLLLHLEEAGWRRALARALERSRAAGAADLVADAVGAPTGLALHPGGLVIADAPVERYAPVACSAGGAPVLQYDLRAAAWAGLVKVDVLGNRALTQIRGARERLRAAGRSVPDPVAGDPPTLARLREGRTIGCFQLETPPVRTLLREMPLAREEDLVAVLALVRPGPAAGAARDRFLRRAAGEEPENPPHPALGDLLAASRGLLLYEDDLLTAIAHTARVDLAAADLVRARLLDAGDDASALALLEERFVARAVAMGSSTADARLLWRELERFASYSFNKAHAASYAEIAWQVAFLRTHAPEAFAAAVLDDYGGDYPLRSVAAAFAREGVRLLAPHVTRSGVDSALERRGGAEGLCVRLGLRHVRGLGSRTVARLLTERERRSFEHVHDLAARARPSRAELEALVLCGALDGVPPLAPEAYPSPHLRLLYGPAARSAGSPAALVRVRNELRFLSMHPSEHPMALLRAEAFAAGAEPLGALTEAAGPVRFAGVLAASRRVRTSAGGVVHFLTVEDETGLVEAVLQGGAQRRATEVITTPGPYLFVAAPASTGGRDVLELKAVVPFHARSRQPPGARRPGVQRIPAASSSAPSAGTSSLIRRASAALTPWKAASAIASCSRCVPVGP